MACGSEADGRIQVQQHLYGTEYIGETVGAYVYVYMETWRWRRTTDPFNGHASLPCADVNL